MKIVLVAAAMGLTIESGHAQFFDPSGAETTMRDLLPANARCERVSWEPMSYCRYETANMPSAIFELSFGTYGPAGSLTYNIGSTEGRQFLTTVRRFFLKVSGVPENTFDQCINQSRSKASEVLVGHLRVKCRYADLADRVGYEIFAEPQ